MTSATTGDTKTTPTSVFQKDDEVFVTNAVFSMTMHPLQSNQFRYDQFVHDLVDELNGRWEVGVLHASVPRYESGRMGQTDGSCKAQINVTLLSTKLIAKEALQPVVEYKSSVLPVSKLSLKLTLRDPDGVAPCPCHGKQSHTEVPLIGVYKGPYYDVQKYKTVYLQTDRFFRPFWLEAYSGYKPDAAIASLAKLSCLPVERADLMESDTKLTSLGWGWSDKPPRKRPAAPPTASS